MLLYIFTGIEISFFLAGMLFALAIVGLIYYNRIYSFNWKSWTLLAISIFLIIFSFLWSISSVLEGEPRSASMGLVIFGLPGLILLALARRLVIAK